MLRSLPAFGIESLPLSSFIFFVVSAPGDRGAVFPSLLRAVPLFPPAKPLFVTGLPDTAFRWRQMVFLHKINDGLTRGG
jgi:hypothetical protein